MRNPVRWFGLGLWMIGTLAGCGGDDGGPSGDTLAVSDVVGLWTFHVDPNTECQGAAGGGDFLLDLRQEDRAPEGSTLHLTTATWGFETQPVIGLADGTVNLESGQADIVIMKGTDNGALITGEMTAAHTFTGTLRDPAPDLEPAFVLGTCQFTMTGERG